jgi:hypothetical protein
MLAARQFEVFEVGAKKLFHRIDPSSRREGIVFVPQTEHAIVGLSEDPTSHNFDVGFTHPERTFREAGKERLCHDWGKNSIINDERQGKSASQAHPNNAHA